MPECCRVCRPRRASAAAKRVKPDKEGQAPDGSCMTIKCLDRRIAELTATLRKSGVRGPIKQYVAQEPVQRSTAKVSQISLKTDPCQTVGDISDRRACVIELKELFAKRKALSEGK